MRIKILFIYLPIAIRMDFTDLFELLLTLTLTGSSCPWKYVSLSKVHSKRTFPLLAKNPLSAFAVGDLGFSSGLEYWDWNVKNKSKKP